MADDTKSKPKSDPKPESKSSDSSSSTPAADSGGKSAKESVGGAAVGHYGYFSNIKSPEYKSGWDDIWGKKKKSRKPAARKTAARKAPEPMEISIGFDDLPADIQAGLAEAARKALKKKRMSYDARDKKGDVSWQVSCTVKR